MAHDQQQFAPPTYAPLHPSPVALPPARTQPRYLTAEYAGFWRRFAAYFLDGLLLALPCEALSLAISLPFAAASEGQLGDAQGTFMAVRSLTTVLLAWLYFALMESSPHQATLGKMALGLIVTDLDGRPISFARASARNFAKCLSGLILLIGYLLIAFTARKQALHDMIAGCLVIMG
jgi:uncharacterized RDD family membrane protein YckC